MRAFLVVIFVLLLSAAAYAAETISYAYDARGRLVKVDHAGTVNNGVTTNYTYDKADNRAAVTVTGAGAQAPIPPDAPGGTLNSDSQSLDPIVEEICAPDVPGCRTPETAAD